MPVKVPPSPRKLTPATIHLIVPVAESTGDSCGTITSMERMDARHGIVPFNRVKQSAKTYMVCCGDSYEKVPHKTVEAAAVTCEKCIASPEFPKKYAAEYGMSVEAARQYLIESGLTLHNPSIGEKK